MPLSGLTESERQVVLECLRAASEGPFFPDEEFHTLFGLDRKEIANVVSQWPDVDEAIEAVQLSINNAMINLLGYPHHREDIWDGYISVPCDEVKRIFYKWEKNRLK